jgi:hypothetical protein
MSVDLADSVEELAEELRGVAAVRPSSVNVTVVDGGVIVECTTQPEGDHAVMMATGRFAGRHNVVVGVYLKR